MTTILLKTGQGAASAIVPRAAFVSPGRNAGGERQATGTSEPGKKEQP